MREAIETSLKNICKDIIARAVQTAASELCLGKKEKRNIKERKRKKAKRSQAKLPKC